MLFSFLYISDTVQFIENANELIVKKGIDGLQYTYS